MNKKIFITLISSLAIIVVLILGITIKELAPQNNDHRNNTSEEIAVKAEPTLTTTIIPDDQEGSKKLITTPTNKTTATENTNTNAGDSGNTGNSNSQNTSNPTVIVTTIPTSIPTVSATATPTSAPQAQVSVDKTSVTATLSKSADNPKGDGALYGSGFRITNAGSGDYTVCLIKPGSGEVGFNISSTYLKSGWNTDVLSKASPETISNGIYTGTEILKYSLSSQNCASEGIEFAQVSYSITVTN